MHILQGFFIFINHGYVISFVLFLKQATKISIYFVFLQKMKLIVYKYKRFQERAFFYFFE
ncbi:hypothetical protein C0W65_03695 [Bacillus subtilis]|nr:hypothetical protein C0W65_03695 [Bacillus subtilis]